MTVFVLHNATGLKADEATIDDREIGVVGVDEGDGERFVELLVTDDTYQK